ncbi:MAG: hypothetical protein JSV96_17490 [Candidatus Aminicenantes bacterium]|nr:MAG: hypothetical protein JSV96_17490 [Candidatus Aminicenantes bacterium]
MGKKKQARSRRKKILRILLVLFLIYATWLCINVFRFKTYTSPALKISPIEIEGVYHIHTKFSDGRSHPDKIAKRASLSSLDFIILTDHGHPNYESLESQGWKEGVLVLAGSELSVSRGHLVALDFEPPSRPFSQITKDAVYEIQAQGGLSIIAHPYSKVQWSWGEFIGYSGIELINGDTSAKRNIILSLPYIPALLMRPDYTLLKMLDSPKRNLRKWDALGEAHPIYGYFASDAHLLYRPLFRLLKLHLMLEKPLSADFETAKSQVYETLRKGRFYNAIDAAAHARGFMFWGEKKEEKIQMGSTFFLDSPVTLHINAPFPYAKEVHLIQNGKHILQSSDKEISFQATEPGVYRVEVYLRERTPLSKEIPWIVSNPIFLRKDK